MLEWCLWIVFFLCIIYNILDVFIGRNYILCRSDFRKSLCIVGYINNYFILCFRVFEYYGVLGAMVIFGNCKSGLFWNISCIVNFFGFRGII